MSGLFKSTFNRESTRSSLNSINWIYLTDIRQVLDLKNNSIDNPVKGFLIFKHSTRCGISAMALRRFEAEWQANNQIDLYFLNLIEHRNISNEISNVFSVWHESPQAILIKKGEVISHASHGAISANQLQETFKTTIQ